MAPVLEVQLMQKHSLIVAVVAVLCSFLGNDVLAQNFNITSTADNPDANPGDGVCADAGGNCTLRAAVMESNALGGAHTLTLPAGTYNLTAAGANEDACLTGDLDVTSQLTINGNSALNTFIDGNGGDRVFHILAAGTVNFSQVTVQGGLVTQGFGGGILNLGTVDFSYCTVQDNVCDLADQATVAGGFGGGVANLGTFTANNTTFKTNTARGAEGFDGVDGGGGGGSTPGFGGAIYNDATGTVTLINCTVSGNRAEGGIASNGSTNNGTFSINGQNGAGPNFGLGGPANAGNGTAGGDYSGGGGGGSSCSNGGLGGDGGYGAGGGGTGARSCGGSNGNPGNGGFGGGGGSNPCCSSGGGGGAGAGLGGGLFNNGGTITCSSVTIAYNEALGGWGNGGPGGFASRGQRGTGYGGGIFNRTGTVEINNTLLAYNLADTVNNTGVPNGNSTEDLWGNFTSTDGHNLVFAQGTATLGGNTAGNIVGQDPLLMPLANYGGVNMTHALMLCPQSPAIDAALTAVVPPMDQRDTMRVNDADIGAYEAPLPPDLDITAWTVDVLCAGDSTGEAGITPIGGSAPYSFVWDSLAVTDSAATNLVAGTYTVTVIDANMCENDTTLTVLDGTAFSLTSDSTAESCVGTADGSAEVMVQGGTAPFNCQWDSLTGFQTTWVASNLTAGTYSVMVTDNTGCTEEMTVIVDGAIPIAATTDSVPTLCFGDSTGQALVSASGGAGTLSFLWDANTNNQTDSTAVNLPAGTFAVTVTDTNGCMLDTTVTITEPTAVQIQTLLQTDISCNGLCDGALEVTAVGGILPYTYNWTPNGPNSNQLTGICAGQVQLSVADSNNCVVDTTVTFIDPDPVVVYPSGVADSCELGIGIVNVDSVVGGTAPYAYQWDAVTGGQTTIAVNGLATGTYAVTVTDTNGCVGDTVITIGFTPAVFVDAITTDVICQGEANGTASANVTGGTGPFQYFWSDNQTTEVATGLLPGMYGVEVIDANGCIATASATVNDHVDPVANFSMDPNPISEVNTLVQFTDLSTGNVTFWDWTFNDIFNNELGTSDQQNPSFNFPPQAGTYTIHLLVMDANGCLDTLSLDLLMEPQLSLYVPNAFTPNGDGINDFFFPEGYNLSPDNYEFSIFNRWGEVIYTTTDLYAVWDGTVDGIMAPDGVYLWKVTVADDNTLSVTNEYTGHVTLFR